MVKSPPANAGDIRDMGSTPGLGRSSGGGHSNPLQYSCLENPMDRGDFAVHRVAKSWTWLKWLSTCTHTLCKQDVPFISEQIWSQLFNCLRNLEALRESHMSHSHPPKHTLIPTHRMLYIISHKSPTLMPICGPQVRGVWEVRVLERAKDDDSRLLGSRSWPQFL